MLILLEVETRASQGEVSSGIKLCQLSGFFETYHCEKVGLFPTTQAMRLMAIIWPFGEVLPVDFVKSWCIHLRQPSSLLKREEDIIL